MSSAVAFVQQLLKGSAAEMQSRQVLTAAVGAADACLGVVALILLCLWCCF